MPEVVCVNLSARQFAQPDLVSQLAQVLEETGLDARQLKLETTESLVMQNVATASAMLKEMKKLGVLLGIDDFGTGYSSLSYLSRFPIDTLKVDSSFVSRIGEDKENLEIVRTIITLASPQPENGCHCRGGRNGRTVESAEGPRLRIRTGILFLAASLS